MSKTQNELNKLVNEFPQDQALQATAKELQASLTRYGVLGDPSRFTAPTQHAKTLKAEAENQKRWELEIRQSEARLRSSVAAPAVAATPAAAAAPAPVAAPAAVNIRGFKPDIPVKKSAVAAANPPPPKYNGLQIAAAVAIVILVAFSFVSARTASANAKVIHDQLLTVKKQMDAGKTREEQAKKDVEILLKRVAALEEAAAKRAKIVASAKRPAAKAALGAAKPAVAPKAAPPAPAPVKK